jgi:hypothetical protein
MIDQIRVIDNRQLTTKVGELPKAIHSIVKDNKEVLVCTVGKTVLYYDFRCIADLHAMLKKHGHWMELGSADEQKPANP